MPDLSDPHPPADRALVPSTPRWRKRHLGVALALGLMMMLGWSAWHYKYRVPTVPSNNAPVPARGLR